MKKNMRKLLALLAAAVMLLAVLPMGSLLSSAATTNLVANGDFEGGTTDGWQTFNKTTITADSKEIGSGSFSGRVDVKDDWAPATITLNLKKNTDYVLTFKMKTNNGKGISINLQKADWSDVVVRLPFEQGATEWTEYSAEFNSGDNDALMFHFQSNCTAAENHIFWLDDVVVSIKGDQPDEPTSNNLIVNGDFEAGNEGWGALGGSTINGDAAKTGNYGGYLAGGQWDGLYQTISVEPNTDYVLSLDLYAVSSGHGELYIKWGDAYGEQRGEWPTTAVGKWESVSYEFNSKDYNSMYIQICKGAAEHYVDNIKVVVKGSESDDPTDEPQDGYIQNGDFETGDDTGWTIKGSAEVTKEAAESGEYGVKITGTGSYGDSAYTIFPVDPDKIYTLTYSIKTISGGPATLYLRGGTVNSDWQCTAVLGDDSQISSSGDWMNMVHTIDPGDNTYVVVHFNGAAGGTHYIDNVKIVENGIASDDGYIVNGDFEVNTGYGWTMDGTAAITEEAAETGTYGAVLTGTGTWGDKISTIFPVEPGKVYTLTYSIKTISGNPATLYLRGGKTPNDWEASAILPGDEAAIYTLGDWTKMTHKIEPGDSTYVVVHFNGADGGTHYLDNIKVTEGWNEPVEPPKPALKLSSFGVLNNRPNKATDNLIVNGSFESDANAQWNTSSFLGNDVYVVDDDTTRSGNKSLYFNSSSNKVGTWHVFWVDVEPGKDYVFSTWLKGAFISDDNRFSATVGVVDPDTRTFMVYSGHVFSSVTEQIVPTAWDNKWHLRSVAFNSGEKTKVGIALYGHSSQLWVDDMALYLMDAGVKYVGENAGGVVAPKNTYEDVGCAEADCLIPDPTFSNALSEDFWAAGGGWKNGFLSFAENAYEYGTSLKYTGTADSNGLYYTKWIDVTPETDYTFSVDMKVLKSGEGKLMLLADKITGPFEFVQLDFSTGVFGNDWANVTVEFNSDVFTRIAVAVFDKGGEALIDNLRLFETSKKVAMEDEFVSRADGWYKVDGNWVYYENGRMVTNKWKMDSVGWCYLGADGYCVTNKWVADSKGWCYLDANGRMVTNKWVMDSVGWCYVDGNGYCVTNKWVADSKGWCYLDGSGRMVTNKWVMDSVGWCYVGADGYCVTNKWVADSKGWCYLDGSGRMVTNKWVKDSVGWCYIGEDGYCRTNDWAEDSKGFCYLDENGHMVYDTLVDGVYYVDSNGYWVI